MTEGSVAGRTGERVLDLVAVLDRLRSPGGCPWDARKTHDSLVEYLVEKAYEAVEAIETADNPALREELGDILLQVVFHARIASEAGAEGWDIDDVAGGIIDKLIARHPHVFADATAETADQVEANWHAQKAVEKGRESVVDGIPGALPALMYAGKVISRSSGLADRLDPIAGQAVAARTVAGMQGQEEFGDLLFALVAERSLRGFDAESAVRGAARRRIASVRSAEVSR